MINNCGNNGYINNSAPGQKAVTGFTGNMFPVVMGSMAISPDARAISPREIVISSDAGGISSG